MQYPLRICRSCDTEKSIDQFSRRGKNGYYWKCKSCALEHTRAWRKKNHDKLRAQRRRAPKREGAMRACWLRRNYGITIEQYDAMLAAQGGVCGICREECSSGRRLAVDHCHQTGRIRGLLCGVCNKALWKVEDSTWLTAAQSYLRS